MQKLTLDIAAGEVLRELVRRGIAAKTRVRVQVEIFDEAVPLASTAQAGRAFDFLADEPNLYSDADLIERA